MTSVICKHCNSSVPNEQISNHLEYYCSHEIGLNHCNHCRRVKKTNKSICKHCNKYTSNIYDHLKTTCLHTQCIQRCDRCKQRIDICYHCSLPVKKIHVAWHLQNECEHCNQIHKCNQCTSK